MKCRVLHVVDGDGMKALNLFSNELIEIRMYGIDAPEIKKCRKLINDEKVTHLPAAFLQKLGFISMKYLASILPPNTEITIKQEQYNHTDIYGRTLAYIYLQDGSCVNELMIKEGYAKPMNDYYCSELSNYQLFNTFAKQGNKGLYTLTSIF